MKSAMDVFAQKKSQKTILIPKFVVNCIPLSPITITSLQG